MAKLIIPVIIFFLVLFSLKWVFSQPNTKINRIQSEVLIFGKSVIKSVFFIIVAIVVVGFLPAMPPQLIIPIIILFLVFFFLKKVFTRSNSKINHIKSGARSFGKFVIKSIFIIILVVVVIRFFPKLMKIFFHIIHRLLHIFFKALGSTLDGFEPDGGEHVETDIMWFIYNYYSEIELFLLTSTTN